MDLNCVEKSVKDRIENTTKKPHPNWRTANLTVPHKGRGSCQYRDLCSRGCPFGAYFSTSSTLPAAMATKRLTVRPYSIVNHIIYDKDTKKAKGVMVIDAETNESIEFYAKIVL
jgi:choline dehydrogenase-like flavoprotein